MRTRCPFRRDNVPRLRRARSFHAKAQGKIPSRVGWDSWRCRLCRIPVFRVCSSERSGQQYVAGFQRLLGQNRRDDDRARDHQTRTEITIDRRLPLVDRRIRDYQSRRQSLDGFRVRRCSERLWCDDPIRLERHVCRKGVRQQDSRCGRKPLDSLRVSAGQLLCHHPSADPKHCCCRPMLARRRCVAIRVEAVRNSLKGLAGGPGLLDSWKQKRIRFRRTLETLCGCRFGGFPPAPLVLNSVPMARSCRS